jgi:hypothetical protein
MAEKNPNNRQEILIEAVTRCLNEMYQKSQPSATWEQVNENVRNNVYGGAKDAYNFYYLADQEYLDILDKYMSMYNIKNRWADDAQLMIDYLRHGGTKNKYIQPNTDEDGNYHPGYRGYEEVDSLETYFVQLISDVVERKRATEKVFELMENCKDFYLGNKEESSFRMSITDYAPCMRKDTVISKWKELGKDITIVDKIEDPYTGEFVLPTELDGYFDGAVFNYDLDCWTTQEELDEWEKLNPKKNFNFDEDETN